MDNKVKKYKTKILLTIILTIICIISIAFFYTQMDVNASFVDGVPMPNGRNMTTGSFAYAIEQNIQGFVNESVDNLLNLSGITASGYHGAGDISYNTVTCLYHRQSTIENATLEIVNVIDINKSGQGKIDIYGKNGAHAQINDNSERIGTQVAYLVFKANQTTSGVSNNQEKLKSTIFNAWHNWGFKNLIESSGVLDNSFYIDSVANTFGPGNYNVTEKNTAEIIAAAMGTDTAVDLQKLNSDDYMPNVEYANGNTYIGPLKMSYSGAATIINVNGKNASWARKKIDGSFELGSGNPPSNAEFYAVITEYVSSASPINVTATVSNSSYTARIVLLKNPSAAAQQLMYFASQGGNGSKSISWTTTTTTTPPSSDYPAPEEEKSTKISGFVWLDVPQGKNNQLNNMYDSGLDSGVNGIRVDLINEYGAVIKTAYTSNGSYTFEGSELDYDQVHNYSVRFYYDGYTYTAVQKISTLYTASKGTENSNERSSLNAQYNPINSAVTKNNFSNTISANTNNMGNYVDNLIEHETKVEDMVDENGNYLTDENGEILKKSIYFKEYVNINFGIRVRELPDIQISNDITSVIVKVNNYQYVYDYQTRKKYYNNNSGINLGVKFGRNYNETYERTVYASDIEAAKDNRAKLSVEVIYAITAQNASTTLQMDLVSVASYYDANYDRVVGWTDTLEKALNMQEMRQISTAQTGSVLNRCDITGINVTLEPGESKHVAYVRYSVSQNLVFALLDNEQEPLRNLTEVSSYQTRYGNNTYKAPGDIASTGSLYAGIDTDSSPNNANVNINSSTWRTDPLNSNNYVLEDDTELAPAFKLELGKERSISGTVFVDEDSDRKTGEGQERLGNGIFDGNENIVKGVTVRLLEVNEANGSIVKDASGNYKVAQYSNGEPAISTTDSNGNYKFGYFDETNHEYVGILPGHYRVEYLYQTGNQILTKTGNWVKDIDNVNEYKSTIITSNVIKKAITNQEIEYGGQKYANDKWYLIAEPNRYSDAIDDLNQRNEGLPSVINNTTTYDVYNKTIAEAFTANMNIGIEHTSADSKIAVWYNDQQNLVYQVFLTDYPNVDLGIIEKPKNSIETTKKITYMRIKNDKQEVLVEGDPSNIGNKLQYVKTGLPEVVPVEIKSEFLQSGTLEVEYTISVRNTSEIDYDSSNYYYYGIKEGPIKTVTINKLVDYMDSEIVYDQDANADNWEIIELEQLRPGSGDKYISEEVYNSIKKNRDKFTIIQLKPKKQLANIQIGEKNAKSVKLYATKVLANTMETDIDNFAEIIEVAGSRLIEKSTSGNYNPVDNAPNESDGDTIKLTIFDPTGKDMNVLVYIVIVTGALLIVMAGVIIIKKKIIDRH